MKLETYLYNKVVQDAKSIVDIANELKTIRMLEDSDLFSKEKMINAEWEPYQLRTIKNLISNIYIILELDEIKGTCDKYKLYTLGKQYTHLLEED